MRGSPSVLSPCVLELEAFSLQVSEHPIDAGIVLRDQALECPLAADWPMLEPPCINVEEQVGVFPALAVAVSLDNRPVLCGPRYRVAAFNVPVAALDSLKVFGRRDRELN
jgi:hypothetical protein